MKTKYIVSVIREYPEDEIWKNATMTFHREQQLKMFIEHLLPETFVYKEDTKSETGYTAIYKKGNISVLIEEAYYD